MSTLVASAAITEGGLPLLQFALAELWDARDVARASITAAALATIGGVGGALARHADEVLLGLAPEPRAAARRILIALVTLDGTRARRTETELAGGDPVARAPSPRWCGAASSSRATPSSARPTSSRTRPS